MTINNANNYRIDAANHSTFILCFNLLNNKRFANQTKNYVSINITVVTNLPTTNFSQPKDTHKILYSYLAGLGWIKLYDIKQISYMTQNNLQAHTKQYALTGTMVSNFTAPPTLQA